METTDAVETVEHYGLSESAWKNLVNSERVASIGFSGNSDIEKDREIALKAINGKVDIKVLPNRSSANDTAIDEAIETIMPDLMEIFTGGEDVAAFDPIGEEDVQAAEQETKVVVHTVMSDNDGFNLIYDYCKDALSLKTGVFKVQWSKETTDTKRIIRDATQEQADLLVAEGVDATFVVEHDGDEAGVIEIIITEDDERCKIEVVAPEDFGVAADTVNLRDTTYCVMRAKKRIQALTAIGIDAEKLRNITSNGTDADSVSAARDPSVDEDDAGRNAAVEGLRQVEIHEHYIRFDPQGVGKLKIYQVLTDTTESTILSVEEVDMIPFSAGTPYRIPHKFYGKSIADKLLEVQKIKTVLKRMMLNIGYFDMNGQIALLEGGKTDGTLDALKRNEPGGIVPIKVKGAIEQLRSAGTSFPLMEVWEKFDTVGEQQSGIVRNAQGLNTKSLHDTARGAQILMSAAQKRVRLIARSLAQGIKDMFLLTHELTRTHGREISFRMNGEYTPVDPSSWGNRKDMQIKIAVGSGGKEERIGALDDLLDKMERLAEGQKTLGVEIVTGQEIFHALDDYSKALGLSAPSRYWKDPSKAEPKEPEQPQPDPAMVKVQVQAQLEQFKAENKAALDGREQQHKEAMAEQRLQFETTMAEYKALTERLNKQPVDHLSPGGALDR